MRCRIHLTLAAFQSTHSRGVRLLGTAMLSRHRNISIHALTRSATGVFVSSLVNHRNFNPRTHEECDSGYQINQLIAEYFNPRTHEECDNRKNGYHGV